MSSDLKVLQVIPKLGYGGAETGCYDIAHYLPENNCKSFIVTSGGELLKFVDRKKVKIFRLPVQSKNPLLILINAFILIGIILVYNISLVHARSRAPAWSCLLATKITGRKFVTTFHGTYNFKSKIKKIYNSVMIRADLIIVAGTVTMKMAPALVRLYEQMPEPKYVIAMGACTITGGMFSADSTTAVRGVDKLIPVDLYLPGCPPRPEAIFDAVIKLRKKVGNESILERTKTDQTHRYITSDHEMNLVFSENTGEYLNKTAANVIPSSKKEKITELPENTEKTVILILKKINGKRRFSKILRYFNRKRRLYKPIFI